MCEVCDKVCTNAHPKYCKKCDRPFNCFAANVGEHCWEICYHCHIKTLDVTPLEWRRRTLEVGNV